MAFQDNSGDIILDMVLTDEGRRRLAKGDGTFKIVKFALGDEEIDYGLYNKGAATALQDLEILQTPILEAFTNNTSTMKTKLITIPRNDLLYLPILRLNEVSSTSVKMHSSGSFMVAVDLNTEDNSDKGLSTSVATSYGEPVSGFMLGASLEGGTHIRVDAGVDNNGAVTSIMDPALVETEFQIDIDNRLGNIVDMTGKTFLSPSSIDDDNVASYILSKNTDPLFIKTPVVTNQTSNNTPIKGPISSFLEFKIRSSMDLKTSYYLFNKIGMSATMQDDGGASPANNVKIIDTTVRVTGLTTGYNVDIPVRFVKLN
tara:strand:- start:3025 stop:3969 length:945 start_codon:yes stop_codon:yes gene_type:complete